MIKRILVPVDGSKHSDKALTLAVDVAEKHAAKLSVLFVASRKTIVIREWIDTTTENHIENLAFIAQSMQLKTTVYTGILVALREEQGIIFRQKKYIHMRLYPIYTVSCCMHNSINSSATNYSKKLQAFIDQELNRNNDVGITAISEQIGKRKIKAMTKNLKTNIVIKPVVLIGDPAEQIVKYSNKQNFDMVFMGNRGLSNIKGMMMGSVSRRVRRLVKCTFVFHYVNSCFKGRDFKKIRSRVC